MAPRNVALPPPPTGPDRPTILARVYPGHHEQAVELFQEDAEDLVAYGYHPVAQSYATGRYRPAIEALAVISVILFGFGILLLLYMAAVRPPGSLAVTFELREP